MTSDERVRMRAEVFRAEAEAMIQAGTTKDHAIARAESRVMSLNDAQLVRAYERVEFDRAKKAIVSGLK